MRLLGRSASDRPLGVTDHKRHVLELDEDPFFPVKLKADISSGGVGRVFGQDIHTDTWDAQHQDKVETATARKKLRKAESFAHLPKDSGRSNLLRAQGALQDTQASVRLQNMSHHHTRRGGDSSRAATTTNGSSATATLNDFYHNDAQFVLRRPGIPPRKTSSRALDEYYDPSTQPLYVSQQTSASAVRDRALRKGSPMIHETYSDPMLSRTAIKSAMKRSPPRQKETDNADHSRSDNREKTKKKMDISHLFPQPRSTSGKALLSPNKFQRSPTAMTDSSDFFSHNTPQAQPTKQTNDALTAPQNARFLPRSQNQAIQRAKVFDLDILDQAKSNVRRPPKGIQNWFDGFDISSDEDELVPEAKAVEIPVIPPQELPADEISPPRDGPPVFFDSWLKPEHEQPVLMRKASVDPVEEKYLSIEQARNRMQEQWQSVDQRNGSIDSATMASIVSSEAPGKKRSGESRLALSRLASESVLSLSDSSEEEVDHLTLDSIDDRATRVRSIASSSYQPSSAPSKPVHIPRSGPKSSTPRMSTSTARTSGSIPIRLTDSIPLPDLSTLPSPPKRPSQASYLDATAQALRKLNGLGDSASQRSKSWRATQASAPFSDNSAGGDTATGLSEAAHVMAVTEEEMILLEMMRSKRAAMQKNSFAEGYQLALKREQEHFMRRRETAQRTALKLLRDQEERQKGAHERAVPSIAETPNDSQAQERKKYSFIRQEDVDKSLKLERFLAEGPLPLEDAFPEPPISSPVEERLKTPQKFELLLPTTYSPASLKPAIDSAGTDDDRADSASIPEDDIEDHHSRIRQFLASSSASDSVNPFPTPPSTNPRSNRHEARRSHSKKRLMSPSPVAEEEPLLPQLPEHSPIRLPRDFDATHDRRRSISGRRLSAHTLTHLSDPFDLPPHPLSPTLSRDNQMALDAARPDSPSRHPTASSTVSTSHASPLTPSFVAHEPTILKATSHNSNSTALPQPEIAGSETTSLRGQTATPDTEPTSYSTSLSHTHRTLSTTKHTKPSTTAPAHKRNGPLPPPTLNTHHHAIQHAMPATRHSPTAVVVGRNKKCENDRSAEDVSGGDDLKRRSSTTSMASAGEDVLAAWAELGGGTEGLFSRRRRR